MPTVALRFAPRQMVNRGGNSPSSAFLLELADRLGRYRERTAWDHSHGTGTRFGLTEAEVRVEVGSQVGGKSNGLIHWPTGPRAVALQT